MPVKKSAYVLVAVVAAIGAAVGAGIIGGDGVAWVGWYEKAVVDGKEEDDGEEDDGEGRSCGRGRF